MIGETLHQYQITASIGAGGMGEVFRARDTRLNRDVAVKVLPKDFVADADRLRRFEQEAKTLAALNHPNVLTIHDAGVHEGAPYLVSELLDGKTLREEMNGGALPVRKATEYALQIAHGLAAAHGKGVIHRDLKPENIFVTKDGRVKILDFGLAKLKDPSPHPSSLGGERDGVRGEAATIRIDADAIINTTEPGIVLGTPAYMSPEQVRGEPADHRADIFAFGCVLYEMLSGTRAFRRNTPVESMNAVLSEEPPELSTTNASIPLALERVVRHCLEKQPDNRFQSAKDLAFALEGTSLAPAPLTLSKIPRWSWAALFLGAVGLTTILWLAGRPQVSSNSAPVARVELAPPGQRFAFSPAPAISPDGRQIAFWAPAPDDTNKFALWVRSLDSVVARVLPGTAALETGVPPSWSPDGRSLAFFSEVKLKRIDLAGGAPLTLADAPNSRGCSWGSSGVIIFVPAATRPIHRIFASGGAAIPLKLAAPLDDYLSWPHFLPDGRHFLISAYTNGLFVISADGKEVRAIAHPKPDSRAEYADGHLFFGREGSLIAQPFDLRTFAVAGEPFRIAENLGFSSGDTYHYAFSVSPAGTLVYWNGPSAPVTQLTWFTRGGQRLGSVGEPNECIGFALSPDAQHAVLERHDPRKNEVGLWLVEMTSGAESKFSMNGAAGRYNAATPVWSRFDDRVYFATFPGLAAQSLQAGSEDRLLSKENCWLSDLSPDGNYALLMDNTPETGADLWILPLKGAKERKPYLTTRHSELGGRFSPDGRWIAYFGDESGRPEVYVQSFPTPGRPVAVSRNGGFAAEWRRDGKELYFLALDGKLMAASVDGAQSPFHVSQPKALFSVGVNSDATRSQYHASEDGERFLVNAPVADTTVPTLKVVLNWKALLKSK